MERAAKRQRLDGASPPVDTNSIREKRAKFLSSLSRGVSPPTSRNAINSTGSIANGTSMSDAIAIDDEDDVANRRSDTLDTTNDKNQTTSSIRSPVQLTRIHDLPDCDNQDTVRLEDILGDPLIEEAWIFNFCFDIDWLMQFFDADVRSLVKVKVVHGSWRREDMNKIMIDDACSRMSNVESIQAYLPDAFGTHHSKMFILFRHDDHAQVVIHTANMLAKDWTNMTQAVWRSPLLPLTKTSAEDNLHTLGSGERFKHDLTRYLKSYGSKLKPLVKRLRDYDFEAVKAALIASVPSRFKVTGEHVWGHEALHRAIRAIPTSPEDSHLVCQVSSIASLPATWLKDTIFRAAGSSSQNVSIIFPTAEDVRSSLDGYSSGGSIHTKAQKEVHMKQIALLRPQLCRWTAGKKISAGRHLAAPHIKTYIKFSTKPDEETPTPSIDWALVTSANLSTQAWGSAAKLPRGSKDSADATIHVQSYEIGVLIWPALFSQPLDGHQGSVMTDQSVALVPSFRTDVPDAHSDFQTIVGYRMPYDLPLTSYRSQELPWSPHSVYDAPDTHGLRWPPQHMK